MEDIDKYVLKTDNEIIYTTEKSKNKWHSIDPPKVQTYLIKTNGIVRTVSIGTMKWEIMELNF